MENSTKHLKNFIFIHDQDIILDFIGKNKFNDLGDFTWVFLGERSIDKIQYLDNLIVARDLPYNIEQYPKLTSFTGWYVLYKNGYLNSKYVNFFEYDIKYVSGFVDINKEMLNKDFDFIGYFPMSISDIVYVTQSEYSEGLIKAVKNKTGFDILYMINKLSPNSYWSSSSNSTWKVSIVKEYLDWMVQYIEDIKENHYSGHIFERSLSFYYFMKNLRVFLVRDLMIHAQLNSHGTSPLPPSRAKHMYNLL
jgi:hypothetical protein